MARQRLGCAVPVRRDAKGGWYFQVIEAIGLNRGTPIQGLAPRAARRRAIRVRESGGRLEA
jgi:hypothetical protein